MQGAVSSQVRALLLKKAKEAISKSYAPYSHVHVGAAILTTRGRVYTGSNVENSSYGLTICAERSAVFSGISKEGPQNFRLAAIAVAGRGIRQVAPCGACRQVLAEFESATTVLYQRGRRFVETSLHELLPDSFNLKRAR
jgi:cytidine deaminase